MQTAEQSALLMHHNTQAYIEAFRAAYKDLDPAQAAERIPELQFLDLALDAIFQQLALGNDKKLEKLVTESSPILDAFMRS